MREKTVIHHTDKHIHYNVLSIEEPNEEHTSLRPPHDLKPISVIDSYNILQET